MKEQLINSFKNFFDSIVFVDDGLAYGIRVPNSIDILTSHALAFEAMVEAGYAKFNSFRDMGDNDFEEYFKEEGSIFKSWNEYRDFKENAVNALIKENKAYIDGVGSLAFSMWRNDNIEELKKLKVLERVRYSDVKDYVCSSFDS